MPETVIGPAASRPHCSPRLRSAVSGRRSSSVTIGSCEVRRASGDPLLGSACAGPRPGVGAGPPSSGVRRGIKWLRSKRPRSAAVACGHDVGEHARQGAERGSERVVAEHRQRHDQQRDQALTEAAVHRGHRGQRQPERQDVGGADVVEPLQAGRRCAALLAAGAPPRPCWPGRAGTTPPRDRTHPRRRAARGVRRARALPAAARPGRAVAAARSRRHRRPGHRTRLPRYGRRAPSRCAGRATPRAPRSR